MSRPWIVSSDFKPHLLIIGIVLLSSLFFFIPFILQADNFLSIEFEETGMQAVYRYWDGPLYVIVSKTFYSNESPLYQASNLGPGYFSAHFPLYPFTIMLLSGIGDFNAMVVAAIVFSSLASLMFYTIVKEFGITDRPLLLAIFFGFFPLRWFLYRNVGATEPAFVFFCLSTIYFLKKDRIPYAVGAASLATLTRIFGIILLPVILASLFFRKQLTIKNILLSGAIPASLFGLFAYYDLSLGDFFAYFSVNQSYLQEPFRIMATFVDSHFGELYAILVIAYAMAALILWSRGEREMALFIIVYLPVISLVAHSDASRYMLPMAPFALMAFENLFPRNRILFAVIIMLTALLSIVYAWTMIPTNLMPEETFTRISEAIGIAQNL
jgi:hypothetical protein